MEATRLRNVFLEPNGVNLLWCKFRSVVVSKVWEVTDGGWRLVTDDIEVEALVTMTLKIKERPESLVFDGGMFARLVIGAALSLIDAVKLQSI